MNCVGLDVRSAPAGYGIGGSAGAITSITVPYCEPKHRQLDIGCTQHGFGCDHSIRKIIGSRSVTGGLIVYNCDGRSLSQKSVETFNPLLAGRAHTGFDKVCCGKRKNNMGSNPTLLRGCQKYNIRPGSSGAVAGPNLFFDQPLIYSRENILLGLGRKTRCPTPGRIDVRRWR